MKIKTIHTVLFFAFLCFSTITAQNNEDLKIVEEKVAVTKKKRKKEKKAKKLKPYEPLAPARAAFYSAILPGLGQIYTGNYWKLPIVYGAIGGGIYAYTWNKGEYDFFRDIYKKRLAGQPLSGRELNFESATDDQLIDFQNRFRRDQELSLLITIGLYLLNIVDANVSAHLQQYNISDDLSFKPKLNFNDINATPIYGLSLNYNF